MRYSERDSDINTGLERPISETLFHERAHLLADTGYMGFTVKSSRIVPSGYRIVIENSNGHSLQADGEHPVEILERLVDMVDAYRD